MDDDTSESGAIDLDLTAIAASLAAASYEVTLFAGVGLIVGGVDDLIVDAVYLWHVARRRLAGERPLTLADMRPTGKRLAIFIAAWDESAVIGRMLANLSQQLTSDRLTVFVGAYPNDPATIEAIAGVAERDRRIRLVIGMRAGPTTKADCLNAVWRAMIEEEALSGEAFDAIILHDAEDLVHAGELAVIDHHLTTAHAVQLPVIPLAHPKAPLVGGTYLDEFAEAHGKSLVVRSAVGAGLPLAGCDGPVIVFQRNSAGCGGIGRDTVGQNWRKTGADPVSKAATWHLGHSWPGSQFDFAVRAEQQVRSPWRQARCKLLSRSLHRVRDAERLRPTAPIKYLGWSGPTGSHRPRTRGNRARPLDGPHCCCCRCWH